MGHPVAMSTARDHVHKATTFLSHIIEGQKYSLTVSKKGPEREAAKDTKLTKTSVLSARLK